MAIGRREKPMVKIWLTPLLIPSDLMTSLAVESILKRKMYIKFKRIWFLNIWRK